jgi:hypothetical protein
VLTTQANFDEHFAPRLIGAWFYVNAYAVTQLYGGPEEGGWWYDYGDPLASVPVQTREEAIRVLKRLRAVLDYERTERPKHQGGIEINVCVSDDIAARYPEVRPHYE